jgi:hypothetical protein
MYLTAVYVNPKRTTWLAAFDIAGLFLQMSSSPCRPVPKEFVGHPSSNQIDRCGEDDVSKVKNLATPGL